MAVLSILTCVTAYSVTSHCLHGNMLASRPLPNHAGTNQPAHPSLQQDGLPNAAFQVQTRGSAGIPEGKYSNLHWTGYSDTSLPFFLLGV